MNTPALLLVVGDVVKELAEGLFGGSGSGAVTLPESVEALVLSSEGGFLYRPGLVPDRWGTVQGLTPELRPGVWADNWRALQSEKASIERNIQESIRRLGQVGRGQFGSDTPTTQVMILTSMSDPVGSAAARFALECLAAVLRDSLSEFPVRVHLVCLSHDLDQQEGEAVDVAALELRGARARVFLQELEGALNEPQRAVRVDFVWLLDSRGQSNRFVQDRRYFAPLVGRTFMAIAQAGALDDQQPAVDTRQQVGGRWARYGTFGVARLVYPGHEYLEITAGAALAERLESAPFLQEVLFDAPSLFGSASEFLTSHSVDRLHEVLATGADGGPVLSIPLVSQQVMEEDDPERFLRGLQGWIDNVQRTELNLLPTKFDGALRAVTERVVADLGLRLEQRIDGAEPGGLAWAEAWLAALRGDSSRWMERSDEQRRDIVQLLDAPIHRFFDPLLVAEAGGDDLDPELLELAGIIISAGVRGPLVVVEQRLREDTRRRQELDRSIEACRNGEMRIEPPDTPETMAGRLEEQQEMLVGRLERMSKLRADLIRIVDNLDQSAESQSDRDGLRDRVLAAHREGRTALIDVLRVRWKELSDLNLRLADLKEYLNRWIVTRGAVVAGAVTVLMVLWFRFSWVRSLSIKFWLAFAAAGLIAVGLDFLSSYWTPRKALLGQINSVRRALRNARGSLVNHWQQEFGIEEEHRRHGQLVVFRKWFRDECDQMRAAVEHLRSRFYSFRDEISERASPIGASDPVPTEDPFEVRIPPAKALEEFLEEKRSDVIGIVNTFWGSSKPSQFITRFSVGVGAPPVDQIKVELDQALTDHFESLDRLVREIFVSEFDFDVDEAFRRGIPTEEKRALFTRELWLAGSPQAFFSSDGFALAPNEFSCLGLNTKGERSKIEEALIASGRMPKVIPQLAHREAQLVRFSIGYPAFSFSPMAKMMPSRPDVSLAPDRFGALPPLEPSLASRSDPEAFKSAVLAKAGGVLKALDGTRLGFEDLNYADLGEVLLDWDTGAGSERRNRIGAQLRAMEEAKEPDGRSEMEVKLSKALQADLSLQADEKKIVEDQLRLLENERGLI